MLICRIGFASTLAFLASCAEPTIEYVRVLPEVPEQLRTPVEKPDRTVSTLKDVGLVLTDFDQALDEANGRITAIDCILDNAAEPEDPRVCQSDNASEVQP